MMHHAPSFKEIVNRLKKYDTDEGFLKHIATSRYKSRYRVQVLLAFHPRTPLQHSLHFLPFLHYRDLARLLQAPYVPIVLKRKAHRLLATRYVSLAKGEKRELARLAGGKILFRLLAEDDLDLREVVLQNPRLKEKDLLQFIRLHMRDPLFAMQVHTSKRWANLYAVKHALFYNAFTPINVLQDMAGDLVMYDMMALLKHKRVSLEVKSLVWQAFKDKVGGLSRPQKHLLCSHSSPLVLNALISLKDKHLYHAIAANPAAKTSHLLVMLHHLQPEKTFRHLSKEEMRCLITRRM